MHKYLLISLTMLSLFLLSCGDRGSSPTPFLLADGVTTQHLSEVKKDANFMLLVFGEDEEPVLMNNMSEDRIEIPINALTKRVIEESIRKEVDIKSVTDKVLKTLKKENASTGIGAVTSVNFVETVLEEIPDSAILKDLDVEKLVDLVDEIMAGKTPVEKPVPKPKEPQEASEEDQQQEGVDAAPEGTPGSQEPQETSEEDQQQEGVDAAPEGTPGSQEPQGASGNNNNQAQPNTNTQPEPQPQPETQEDTDTDADTDTDTQQQETQDQVVQGAQGQQQQGDPNQNQQQQGNQDQQPENNDPPPITITDVDETPNDPPFVPPDPPGNSQQQQGTQNQQQQANNAPVFSDGSSTTRAVAENTFSGENIGSPVSATDADNDTLTYTLGGTDASSFSIVSSSGQLQTSAALNYEVKSAYAVTVSVSDGNGGSDSITVTINVTDVDEDQGDPPPGGITIVGDPSDPPPISQQQQQQQQQQGNNAPVFTDGTSTTREVEEGTGANRTIGAPVSATDVDGDPLTYTLGGTHASSFDITPTKGQLLTKIDLDHETKSSYSVTVSVSDGRGGSNSIAVTINVADVIEAGDEVTINVSLPTGITLAEAGYPISGSSITLDSGNLFTGTGIAIPIAYIQHSEGADVVYEYTLSDFAGGRDAALFTIAQWNQISPDNTDAALMLTTGQLTRSSYALRITKGSKGTFKEPVPGATPREPPALPTSAFSVGDSGSASASVSGQRLDGTGQPIDNTSLPGISDVGDADNNNYEYDIKFSLNVNIGGWERQGAYETKTYEDAQFRHVDAIFSNAFFIGDDQPDDNDLVKVKTGSFTVFTYLADHYLDREISLGSGTFKKDLGRGYKAVMTVTDVVITITGGTGNPDTLSYTVKSISGASAITREP